MFASRLVYCVDEPQNAYVLIVIGKVNGYDQLISQAIGSIKIAQYTPNDDPMTSPQDIDVA
jgi:hypothetical protein